MLGCLLRALHVLTHHPTCRDWDNYCLHFTGRNKGRKMPSHLLKVNQLGSDKATSKTQTIWLQGPCSLSAALLCLWTWIILTLKSPQVEHNDDIVLLLLIMRLENLNEDMPHAGNFRSYWKSPKAKNTLFPIVSRPIPPLEDKFHPILNPLLCWSTLEYLPISTILPWSYLN